MIRFFSGLALLLIVCWQAPTAQGLEFIITDTLWVKTTFYDFKANTNFGAKSCGTATGEVQDTLDRDRKPILARNRCSNDLLAQWFRPSGAPGATFQPFTGRWTTLVSYKGKPNEWTGQSFNAAENMANIVIYDSLPFILTDAATGTYSFSRTNKYPTGGFFWLDGKGFGEEPAGSGHNFYYTMELHKEFVYRGGEHFSFRGDDDVWVFINGRLALDLGGMQAETKRALTLDAIAGEFGLVKGHRYPMDFFYCERHEPQSNCEITTNLLTPLRPLTMIVTTSPLQPDPRTTRGLHDTTMKVGEVIPLYVHLFDDEQVPRTNFADKVTWKFNTPQGASIRPDTVAAHVDFIFPKVNGCVTIYLTYDDPLDSLPAITNSILICPKSGGAPADTVVPNDTATIPHDTSVTPHDTTASPRDTTASPRDTTNAHADTVGALIKRVLFYPGVGVTTYDTLKIILTDPVDCKKLTNALPENVFGVSDNGILNSKALAGARFIGGCENSMVTQVMLVVPVDVIVITPEKDSLLLDGESPYVVDEKGKLPPEKIQPVMIEWGSTGIIIGALPNPSSPTTIIDEKTVQSFRRNFTEGRENNVTSTAVGTLVVIQTKVPLVPVEHPPAEAGTGVIYGVATVYDAVGNLLASNLPLKLSELRNTYGIYWNMRNKNMRAVGRGAYLINVSLRPENRKTSFSLSVKVGAN